MPNARGVAPETFGAVARELDLAPTMPFTEQRALPTRELAPGVLSHLLHTERMTFSFVDLDRDATVPPHAHPHEQVTIVVDGDLELTVGGETRVMRPGEVAVIPSGVRHAARGATACRVLDVFQPVRDDYR